MISLEVSHTGLGRAIQTPRPVREVDWIDHVWKARGGEAVEQGEAIVAEVLVFVVVLTIVKFRPDGFITRGRL